MGLRGAQPLVAATCRPGGMGWGYRLSLAPWVEPDADWARPAADEDDRLARALEVRLCGGALGGLCEHCLEDRLLITGERSVELLQLVRFRRRQIPAANSDLLGMTRSLTLLGGLW